MLHIAAPRNEGYANQIVQARIDRAIKEEAATVLASIGLTVSDAVRLLLTKVVHDRALPFDPLIPNATTIAAMREARAGNLPKAHTLDELKTALVASDHSTPPDAQTQRAVKAFLKHIASRYPAHEAFLFGSRARNTHTPESDTDIAIILKGSHGDRAAAVKDMAAIAFHVLMETGVMVEALPLGADDVKHPETFSNPALIDNILREGIRL